MLRVFVGTSDGHDCEAQAVLEYSLRVHASEPVDLTWLKVSRDRNAVLGGWNTANWGTPFSGLRWACPALCGFEGRAVYLDADMILMGDIAELWNQPIPDGAVALVKGEGKKQRTCVMVMDCAAAGRWLPALRHLKSVADGSYINGLLASRPELTGQIEGAWNCVDLKSHSLDDPALKLLHYSSIAHQPSTPHAVARLAKRGLKHWYDGEVFEHWRPELAGLFEQLLAEASAAGFPVEAYEVAAPYIPPMRSYRGVRVKGFSA